MATLVSDLQTRLAYRLRENSTPGDTNEVARRLSFLNEGNRKILGEHYWWFLETISSDTTVSGQEIYSLDTYFRDMIELRVDGKVYANIDKKQAFGSYRYPPSDYYYGTNSPRFYTYADTELHLIPIVSSTPSALTISSITRSGTTATITTSTDHGYSVNTYVTIAGADQTDYNGAFRVQSIPSSTSFTITVAGSPTTPATGTMTATERNIVKRYWSKVVPLTSNIQAIQIPDDYSDVIIAYAEMRLQKIMGRRGSAGDATEEFNQLRRDLISEDNRRKMFNKSQQPPYGEYV